VALPRDPGMTNRSDMAYEPTGLEDVMRCIDCEYDESDYNIFHFAWCIQERWHIWVHAGLGGFRFTEDGDAFAGDFNGQQGNSAPVFIAFHNTVDMFSSEWLSKYSEWSNTSWGFPYENGFNYLQKNTYSGINIFDTINSAFPMRWYDLGWMPVDGPGANKTVTYLDSLCSLTKQNADYLYVKFSGAPDGAPGEIVEPRNSTNTTTTYDKTTEPVIALADADMNDLLPAAEAFLSHYDANVDNRLGAAEAFLETLSEENGLRK